MLTPPDYVKVDEDKLPAGICSQVAGSVQIPLPLLRLGNRVMTLSALEEVNDSARLTQVRVALGSDEKVASATRGHETKSQLLIEPDFIDAIGHVLAGCTGRGDDASPITALTFIDLGGRSTAPVPSLQGTVRENAKALISPTDGLAGLFTFAVTDGQLGPEEVCGIGDGGRIERRGTLDPLARIMGASDKLVNRVVFWQNLVDHGLGASLEL